MNEIKVDFRPLIFNLEILTKKFVESEYSGESVSQNKKKGLEFEDFKPFSPGDDASLIDWKASLRTGNLLIRQFTELKTRHVFIIVDVSNSMLFSSNPKLKCEYAAELAASLSYFYLKSDDLVSVAMVSDKMEQFIFPSFGSKHFALITKALGNPKLYGGNFNLSNAINYLQRQIRGGSQIIIISDFLGMEKDYFKPLSALTAKADVTALIIKDPEDLRLNEKIGHVVIEDPFSDETLYVDMEDAYIQYAQLSDETLKTVRKELKKTKIDSLVLETDKSFVDPLVRFFARRGAAW